VDATILEGRTTVDESMLTGESTPLDREPGGRVLAGSLNYEGAVTCRAESLGEATMLAQITRMAEQAQGSRAPMERLADRASSIFVPVVLALAALTFVIWILPPTHCKWPWPRPSPCWWSPAPAPWDWPCPPRSLWPWGAARSLASSSRAVRRWNELRTWT
jgi:cation transport ATPase